MLELNDEDRAVYEWQLSIADFGEEGQRRLKNATVLISRAGGVGGLVAYQLAAAGVGRLVVAHAGNVRPSDLNRQLLMTHDWLGKPRIESIQRRLRELNPRLDVLGVAENISEENAAGLVRQVDLVVDCAPLFAERFAMNRQCVLQGKPLVECAMYELEAQCTTILPGETPCLQCLYPQAPPSWTRQFPVFGAVSGTIACIAAMEAIKVLADFGQPLASRMLRFDLRTMDFQILAIRRRPSCNVCGKVD